jgi:type I restriction enzyme S subunit
MSYIDKLIAARSPAGVSNLSLGEVCLVKTGANISKEMIAENPGPYPVLNSGAKPLGFYAEFNTENDAIGIASRGSVGLVTWTPGRFFRGNLNYAVSVLNHYQLDQRFLFHYLLRAKLEIEQLCTFQGIPALNKANLEKLVIPIPPIEVQREIVRILDQFTQLEAELEAELEARRKHYEYYRNQLLNFPEQGAVRWASMEEVCFINDGTHQTPTYQDHGIPFVSVENIRDLKASTKYISGEDFRQLYKNKPAKGDLLMTRIGSIGVCAIVPDDQDLAYYVTLALIRPKDSNLVSSEFIKFYLESDSGRQSVLKRSLLNAVPMKINLGEIGKVLVPIPPLEDQVRIVEILSYLEEISAGTKTGLPAEITARRRQYEYYRDKLLTFKELKAS